MSSRRTIYWSELPPELLTLIVDRLGTKSDTDNFRLVCSRWQVAASYSNHRPLNLLSPNCPYKFSFPNADYRGHFNFFHPTPFSFITLVPISVFLVRSLVDAKRTPWLLTVEELNPGKLSQRQPLSQYTSRFSQSPLLKKSKFNPSYFDVSEIGRSYQLRCDPSSSSICNKLSKVVLIVDRFCPTYPTTTSIDDYNVIGVTNDGSLYLISIKFRTIRNVYSSKIKVYDDVVIFEGSVFAIDRKGRLYIWEDIEGTLRNVVPLSVGEGLGSDMKKRLAETNTGELFLIHRCPAYFKAVFKIYKLNDERNKWDEVVGIGDDRILFVDSGGCFFANTKDLPGWRGNCMVFCGGEFRAYNNQSSADSEFFGKNRNIQGDRIVVFHFDTGDWELVECHPHYDDLFASQPGWLESDAHLFNRMSAVEKQIARDLYSRVASEPTSEAGIIVPEAILAVNNQEGATTEGASPNPIPNIGGPRIIDMESFPAIQVTENGLSQGTFRGVSVRPDLVPVLQKIWDKYGNLIQTNVMKNSGLLTWAVESIAKMVIILQANSSESLSGFQAAYLNATLDDLQLLPIRLDWLVPFVRRALTQHKTQQSSLFDNSPIRVNLRNTLLNR